MSLLVPFNSDPSNEFTVQLGDGVKYTFLTKYNEGPLGDGGFWTFDMTREVDGVKLLSGVKVVLGQDLLGPYALGIGTLIAVDESNTDTEAGPDDLGDRVNVYWVGADEIAAVAAANPIDVVETYSTTPGPANQAAFTPLALGSQLKLWLHADNNLTLSGSNVTAWGDFSGNGLDTTVTGTIPVVANAINGRAGLSFPGGTAKFENAVANVLPAGAARTVFVVCKATTEFGGPLMEFQRSSGIRCTLFQGGTAYTAFPSGVYTDSVDGSRNATITPPLIAGVPTIVEHAIVAMPAPVVLRINGASQAVTQTNPCDAETGVAGFSIGNWAGGATVNYVGIISQVIVVAGSVADGSLSAANAALVRNYLGVAYRIATS